MPLLGFARVPPGAWLWIPVSLLVVYFAFMWGGWAVAAGQSLFVLFVGRQWTAADLGTTRLLAVILMAVVVLITLFGRKISRTVELTS